MLKISRSTIFLGLTVLFSSISVTTASAQTTNAKPDAVSPAPIYTAAETADFIKLAKATLVALAASKNTDMVAKLTDLETAWDDNEATLKPRDEKAWASLDKTLDKAISALRSSHTNLEKGKTALEALIKQLLQATKS